ncbi:MAG: SLOG family protein [Eubacteriales bacterium]|nr:SLOG family protein [Eubacteriales bacterium]MDD3881039.1 SLOG family protein [Eubacteriales bacterium]MDD4511892.1 SLOG family protein [Eubacteriales bacterium]
MLTCAFTGHRPQHLHICGDDVLLLKRLLYQAIERAYSLGCRNFISGMALGVDQWAAREVIAFRALHGDVRLHCAIPCSGQYARWRESDRRNYFDIIRSADSVTVLAERYSDGCMQRRDRWMIEKSDRLIALYTGRYGGTFLTIKMAEKKGIPIDYVMFRNENTRPSDDMLGRDMKLIP